MSENEVEIRVTSKDTSAAGFTSAKQRAEGFGRDVTVTMTKAGDDAGAGFRRGLDGKLRDARGRFVKAGHDAGGGFQDGAEQVLGDGRRGLFSRFFDSISSSAANAGENVQKALTQMFSGAAGFFSLTAATGGMNLLVGAVVGLAAAAAAAAAAMAVLAPVLLVVGGAAGASATLVAGLAATVGVLVMGLGGLGDAWSAANEQTAGGASRAKATAAAQREVKAATDALTDAQREAREATEAVSRAREEEAERLEDLSRSLAGARLDEEGSILAVQRAELRLREARTHHGLGAALDIAEAELAYRQALLAVDDMHDRVEDLGKEQDDASRKGIEGSDAVQAALRRQELAQRHLADAYARLADAQSGLASGGGGVDKFAEAMGKLSTNARALITALLVLKPQFHDLKMLVQDRLLAGFADAVKDLATKWLPALGPMLGGLADSLNRVGRTLLTSLGRSDFIRNIQAGVAGFAAFVERVGKAIAGPLIDAFGRLARASVPFLAELGDMIAGLVEHFSAWIRRADESGALTTFMHDAAKALRDIWDIGGLALAVLGDIAEILWPGSKRASSTIFEQVKSAMQGWHEWLSDPKNQKAIQDWIDKIQDFAERLQGIVARVDEWTSKIDSWKNGAVTAAKIVATVFTGLAGVAWTMRRSIAGAFSGMWDGLKEAFRSAVNWVIDKWNRLKFHAPVVNFMGSSFGGGEIGLPPVQRLAHGGIAGGLAMVGERGRELVRLPHGSTVIPNGTTEAMMAGGSGGTLRVQAPIQLVLPGMRVLHEQFVEFALDTGRRPAALWPA